MPILTSDEACLEFLKAIGFSDPGKYSDLILTFLGDDPVRGVAYRLIEYDAIDSAQRQATSVNRQEFRLVAVDDCPVDLAPLPDEYLKSNDPRVIAFLKRIELYRAGAFMYSLEFHAGKPVVGLASFDVDAEMLDDFVLIFEPKHGGDHAN